jgi:hypothetical protein
MTLKEEEVLPVAMALVMLDEASFLEATVSSLIPG